MADGISKLESALANAASLTQRIDALNELAWALRHSERERAVSLSEEARRLATTGANQDALYTRGLAIALAHLGGLAADQGDYTRGLTLLLRALPMLEEAKEDDTRRQVFSFLGRIFVDLDDPTHALQYMSKAVSLARATGNRSSEAASLNNVAWIYLRSGDYQMAMSHVQLALALSDELDDHSGNAHALDTRSSIHLGLGHIAEAIEDARRSVALARRTQNWSCEAEALSTLGRALLAEGHAAAAVGAHEDALASARAHGLGGREAATLCDLAAAEEQRGRPDVARERLLEALALSDKMAAHSVRAACHRDLARLFKADGDYGRALEHFERYHELSVTMANDRADARVQTLQIVHRVETTRKEAEIYQLRNVTLQQEIEERRYAQAELERLATTDPLTHLANRRQFIRLAQAAVEEAVRYNRPLALLMFDLDRFKTVNDTHGHAVGDQVLVAVAKLACGNVRQVDVMARYGGEEFAVLLPETTAAKAVTVAERLRNQVAQRSIATSGGAISVTISLGITALVGDTPLSLLLERVDAALYEAKRTGRNRVVVDKAVS